MATSCQRVTLAIYGLSCGGGGALGVERALEGTPGVLRAYVNPLTEMAYVELDPGSTTHDRLVAAVRHAGFDASAPEPR
ncbi:MAG: heavy-metal-associated domain-containing protein [Chloroflexi bacterium]|nr:heavy-metal-associated domain-containing protein [Chloroflexota bacterium]